MSTQRRVRHLWNGKACTCNCRSCALDGLGSEVVYAARAFSRGATMELKPVLRLPSCSQYKEPREVATERFSDRIVGLEERVYGDTMEAPWTLFNVAQ